MKTNKEIKAEIMQKLKEKGITGKEVSLSMRASWYDDIITAKIHNAKINIKEVEKIINNYESIRRCERSGEVLNGCNVYIHVEYAEGVKETARAEYMAKAEELTKKALEHWATVGGACGFDLFNDGRIYIFNDGSGDTTTSIHTATEDERRRGWVSHLSNDIADLLLQESAAWFGTAEQVKERLQREEAERVQQMARYEEERKKREIERIAYKKEEERNTKLINAHSHTEDIPEDQQVIIQTIWPSLNKNNTLREYTEQLKDITSNNYTKARITRKWTFTNNEALKWFLNSLLTDYEQIAGLGGTWVTDEKEYITLAIGIYFENILVCLVDPQGYGYARYVGFQNDSISNYRKIV
jgi:hypothetical protein